MHRQDSTYYGLCYTSRGSQAGTRNSSMGPPHEGSIRRPIAPWANALTTELHLALLTDEKDFTVEIVPNRQNYRIYDKRKKEDGTFLFHDVLNTFYLRLYGIGYMVKYHSDSERRNPLPPHGITFPINGKGSFITDRIAHTTAFVTPVVEHWLEREIAH